ncbi:hypothetical protein OG923_33885 (plasmid) [Streptomyces halstedii]|uniref:hypothetical protein n=1 Tax=Streptomyces halstedii TaxID=1944 RepID=UPI002F90D3E5
MADLRNTEAFKALTTQTQAELLTRGLDVVSVAVTNVRAVNQLTLENQQLRQALEGTQANVIPLVRPRT